MCKTVSLVTISFELPRFVTAVNVATKIAGASHTTALGPQRKNWPPTTAVNARASTGTSPSG